MLVKIANLLRTFKYFSHKKYFWQIIISFKLDLILSIYKLIMHFTCNIQNLLLKRFKLKSNRLLWPFFVAAVDKGAPSSRYNQTLILMNKEHYTTGQNFESPNLPRLGRFIKSKKKFLQQNVFFFQESSFNVASTLTVRCFCFWPNLACLQILLRLG